MTPDEVTAYQISIHAAREGGDRSGADAEESALKFQSTPPVKAATGWGDNLFDNYVFQSTPPVKAATKEEFRAAIKALFQSTPPVKAATIGRL